LFAEFSQSDAPEARERGGTGLGLAISRRLARAMGGDITLDSAPGRGATFTVELELRPVDGAGPAISVATPNGRRPRVLLAIDRPIERRALAATLRSFGITAVERDIVDADLDQEADADLDRGEPFDLVIVDGHQPASAAAALVGAEQERHTAKVKGVTLIDSLSRNRADEFRAVGVESYLVRPVRPLSLLAQVGLTTAHTGAHPDALAAPNAGVDLGLRVLLAEDNPINALLAERMLASVGCQTTRAVDGLAAIEAIEVTYAGREPPYDVILMDVHMPRLDGLQAAAALKRLSKAAVVPPVIALTANAFREDREACLAAGYDDYLSKPFGKDELVDLLKRWCLTARGQAA
jgi:CheY-like chemotaxis protein